MYDDDFGFFLFWGISATVFSIPLLLIVIDSSSTDDQRAWIESNIEENYTVIDSVVEFDEGLPKRDDENTRFFTVEGRADDHQKFAVEGYLDFDEQVVIIRDDADGSVLPVEGSDAAQVLEGSNAE